MASQVNTIRARDRARAVLFVLFAIASMSHRLAASSDEIQSRPVLGLRGRLLMELEDEEDNPIVPEKKTSPITKSLSLKNQTKSAAKVKDSGMSLKNQTKSLKPNNGPSTKNQTKQADSSKSAKLSMVGSIQLNSSSALKLKKLNSTSNAKSSNSTKTSASSTTKKSLDLIKVASGSSKNKTSKPTTSKESEIKKLSKPKAKLETEQVVTSKETKTQKPKPKPKQPSWVDDDEDEDLVLEFRDLPTRFQQTLLPDLEMISTTSKAYITKANKQITKGFKPYVGNKYAPTIASVVSFAFILIPFLLVSLIFNRIKAYFSLQRLLIFIQIYLSIYFSILCLSSLTTGLEPLRFFYAASPSTYVCIQVIQTLGYVLYLLMLLMYLVLVFSTDCGLGQKFLSLAQTFVGYAVGLHYYVVVFHRMVLRQPPKTNWKIHGVYAACFLVICLLTQAERRKKAYLDQDGGEEGKKS